MIQTFAQQSVNSPQWLSVMALIYVDVPKPLRSCYEPVAMLRNTETFFNLPQHQRCSHMVFISQGRGSRSPQSMRESWRLLSWGFPLSPSSKEWNAGGNGEQQTMPSLRSSVRLGLWFYASTCIEKTMWVSKTVLSSWSLRSTQANLWMAAFQRTASPGWPAPRVPQGKIPILWTDIGFPESLPENCCSSLHCPLEESLDSYVVPSSAPTQPYHYVPCVAWRNWASPWSPKLRLYCQRV